MIRLLTWVLLLSASASARLCITTTTTAPICVSSTTSTSTVTTTTSTSSTTGTGPTTTSTSTSTSTTLIPEFFVAPQGNGGSTACAKSCVVQSDCGIGGVCTAATGGSVCTAGPAFGDGSIGNPYQSPNYALRNGTNVTCGTALEFRGGVYRMAFTPFVDDSSAAKRLQGCDDDDNDDSGLDGTHTVVPVLGTVGGVSRYQCTPGHELILENAAGEDAVIDASDTHLDAVTWAACTGTSPNVTCCGTGGLRIPSPSDTYCITGLNVGSANNPQLWADPSAGNPGTRLAYWANSPGLGGASCANHDLIPAGTTAFMACPNLIVARFADGSSPNTHVMRMAVQVGAGGFSALGTQNGTAGVIIRQNPAGGSFTFRYGRVTLAVQGASSHILFDTITGLAAGSADYGHIVGVSDGTFTTFTNGTVHESMAEGVAFYGGGPGGANGSGIQIHDNIVSNTTVYNTGLGWVDGGGAGTALGMGIILKNCTNCQALNNTVHTTYRDGIEVTTSTDCAGNTASCHADNVILDSNVLYDNGHFLTQSGAYPGTQGGCGANTCGCVNIQPVFSASFPGFIDSVRISNNWCRGDYTGTVLPQGAAGILFQGQLDAVTNGLIANNAIRNIDGPCINVDQNAHVAIITNNAMDLCSQGSVNCNVGPCDLFTDNTTTHIHDTNDYWAANSSDVVVERHGGATYTRSGVTSYEADAVETDPLWVSSTNFDTQNTSGLINTGTDLSGGIDPFDTDFHGTFRPVGPVWDVGAMENLTGGTTSTSSTSTSTTTTTDTNPTSTSTSSTTTTSTSTSTTTTTSTSTTTTTGTTSTSTTLFGDGTAVYVGNINAQTATFVLAGPQAANQQWWITGRTYTKIAGTVALTTAPTQGQWDVSLNYAEAALPGSTACNAETLVNTGTLCSITTGNKSCAIPLTDLTLLNTGVGIHSGSCFQLKVTATSSPTTTGTVIGSLEAYEASGDGISAFTSADSGGSGVTTYLGSNQETNATDVRGFFNAPADLKSCTGAVALNTAPGTGKSWTVQIQTSTAAKSNSQACSDLTYNTSSTECTIAGTNKSCSFPIDNTLTVAAGGCIRPQITAVGGPATFGAGTWSIECSNDTAEPMTANGAVFAHADTSNQTSSAIYGGTILQTSASVTTGYWVTGATQYGHCAGTLATQNITTGAGVWNVALRYSGSLTTGQTCVSGASYTTTATLCSLTVGTDKSCAFTTTPTIPPNACVQVVATPTGALTLGTGGQSWTLSCTK